MELRVKKISLKIHENIGYRRGERGSHRETIRKFIQSATLETGVFLRRRVIRNWNSEKKFGFP